MSLFSTPFDRERDRALVTGAGNGIGRAIALGLVGEGVRTLFADVSAERVKAAVGASERPDLALPWVGDLARPDACDELLATADAALGQVSHFVHSASPPRREADHALAVDGGTWQQMHAVNLDAGFHLARELAKRLIAAKRPGSFLFLTSLHAGTPRNLPHYSTAKAGMAMLVKGSRRALVVTTSASMRWCRALSRRADLSRMLLWRNTFRSGVSARPTTSCLSRSPCCRTSFRVTSPEQPSSSTADCR